MQRVTVDCDIDIVKEDWRGEDKIGGYQRLMPGEVQKDKIY